MEKIHRWIESEKRVVELEAENARLRGELSTVDDLFRQSRAKLEEVQGENACLRDAIEWFLDKGWMLLSLAAREGVQNRAFPPKMETVEVKVWAIIAPSGFVETTSVNESLQRDQVANIHSSFYGYRVIELKGIDQRPIPVKKRVREELTVVTVTAHSVIANYPEGAYIKNNAKYFREYDE